MKIVIDAGHGLDTPGKRTPDGMKEFEFNNAVALEVASLLGGYKDVKVIFAHDLTGKRDVMLNERVYAANKNKADAFISIHANAYGTDWNDANGIETFVYRKELNDATMLATAVQEHLVKATGLRNRGVKAGDFQVLRATMMPAILVECGFMTNKKEAALLKSDAYRKKCAAAIVAGIVETYNLKKSNVIAPTPTPPPSQKYRLVTGTFSNKADAERVMKELQKHVKVVYLKEE